MATRGTVRLCVWAGKDSGMNVNTDGNDSAHGGTPARWLVLAAVVAAVIVVGFLAMAIYSTQLNARSDGTKRTPLPIAARAYAGEETDGEATGAAGTGKDAKAEDEPDAEAGSGGSGQQAAASGGEPSGIGAPASGSASPGTSASGGTASSGSASPSGSSAASQPQRTWVEDTEQVWVVDSAAWDEQVPVYGQVGISVCNYCGADITGNEGQHTKDHVMSNGTTKGTGWHEEFVQEITGYDTVHHDETGHYETVSTGGHWE